MEERKEKEEGEEREEGRGGEDRGQGERRNFVTSHNPSVCNVQTGNSKERKQGCQAGEGTTYVYISLWMR